MQKPVLTFLSESNHIEGVYDSKSLELASEAWEYLSGFDRLTEENLLWCHHILMKNHITTGDGLGEYRRVDVMIAGRLGAKPPLIKGMMDGWITHTNTLVSNAQTNTNQIKLQHIRFEKIHPFIDGNGRMGRILLNWTRDKLGIKLLVIYEKEKYKYYKWFE